MKRHPSLVPLSHEHQHGLALAVMIDRRSDTPERLRARVRQAWADELQNHFRVEERFLFPAVQERIADPGLVASLIEQHRELEGLVAQVDSAGAAALEDTLQAFGKALSGHIRVEERVLFEQVQAALDEAELEALGDILERETRRSCPSG